ncbi:hypothetical protein CDAR_46881 [Caerostris darwini]|uniref:Uncharacterized protein n=1 Tax=Caerostris darwini TaxID=1538125 RepID=A0AAV4SXS7_9ARAC|nr:hypothetical protein CDAR_46881 [Caerostris darwini]
MERSISINVDFHWTKRADSQATQGTTRLLETSPSFVMETYACGFWIRDVFHIASVQVTKVSGNPFRKDDPFDLHYLGSTPLQVSRVHSKIELAIFQYASISLPAVRTMERSISINVDFHWTKRAESQATRNHKTAPDFPELCNGNLRVRFLD